jgi:hypothetical protein
VTPSSKKALGHAGAFGESPLFGQALAKILEPVHSPICHQNQLAMLGDFDVLFVSLNQGTGPFAPEVSLASPRRQAV